jgi:4-hydroxybenzoate polyprenyltransferase
MNRSGKLHALLSTARVANIPSVLSNVWLGVAVAILFQDAPILWGSPLQLTLAGVLLYIAGNFFNDWMDRAWDAKHRPERALPRCLFSPTLYLALAVILATLGVSAAALVNSASGTVALAIVGCILIYTVWHKRSPWLVIAMGLCRALLPVLGFVAFDSHVKDIWLAAGGLFCYIAGLSLSARYESMPQAPNAAMLASRTLLMMTAALMIGEGLLLQFRPPLVLSGLIAYGIWLWLCLTVRRRPVSAHASSLLAGIPWVDWIVLLPISLSLGSWNPFAIACFSIPPIAFISALLLQRLAPAT